MVPGEDTSHAQRGYFTAGTIAACWRENACARYSQEPVERLIYSPPCETHLVANAPANYSPLTSNLQV